MKKFKVDLIIQARMGSTRLPGKSLMNLYGEPLVGRILERVKRCKNVNDIILAIPDTNLNKPLKQLADDYEVFCFQGSEDNLLERYFRAAKLYHSNFICRLPADNATPEPLEIDKLIEFHLSHNQNGFSSNLAEINNSGYPDGIGIEIFSFPLLKEIYLNCTDHNKKEHIHLNFYDYSNGVAVNQKKYPVKTILCPSEYRRPDLVLDINTLEQYQFINKLYTDLYPKNSEFSIIDIIDWYDNKYLKAHPTI